MKKNILVFGGNSHIGKKFIEKYGDTHAIYPVYRQEREKLLNFEFTSNNYESFAKKVDFKIDAIVFFQGINPSMSVDEITEDHFMKMLKVNLVAPALLLQSLKNKLADGAAVIFFSSVAKRKGSYDPSYAAAKSGLVGLMHSFANVFKKQRFNILSLGLVENSPVYNQMSDDFKQGHAARMRNGNFVKADNVADAVNMIINNSNINRADISIDSGFL